MWGSMFVPMEFLEDYDPFAFQLLMGVAIFLSMLVLVPLVGDFVFTGLGVLSGVLWAVGNTISVESVRESELAVAQPLWSGTVILVSFGIGVALLGEAVASLPLGLGGVTLLLVGLYLVSPSRHSASETMMRGVTLALLAGAIFGTYLVPLKLSGLSPFQFLFSMSLGVLLGCLIIFLLKRPDIDTGMVPNGLASGTLWNLTNIGSLFAVTNLGVSIGIPLTQNALLIAAIWGIFYFDEESDRRRIRNILLGGVLLIIGSAALSFAS